MRLLICIVRSFAAFAEIIIPVSCPAGKSSIPAERSADSAERSRGVTCRVRCASSATDDAPTRVCARGSRCIPPCMSHPCYRAVRKRARYSVYVIRCTSNRGSLGPIGSRNLSAMNASSGVACCGFLVGERVLDSRCHPLCPAEFGRE